MQPGTEELQAVSDGYLRSDFSAVDIKKYPEISGGFCAEKHLNQRNKACTNTDLPLYLYRKEYLYSALVLLKYRNE